MDPLDTGSRDAHARAQWSPTLVWSHSHHRGTSKQIRTLNMNTAMSNDTSLQLLLNFLCPPAAGSLAHLLWAFVISFSGYSYTAGAK